LVNVVVSVRAGSGAGAPVGDTEAQVVSFEGEDLAQFQSANGAEASVPQNVDLRRVRIATICNAQVSVFAPSDDDDRFDWALSYLRARC
jgi:hypothetical protein